MTENSFEFDFDLDFVFRIQIRKFGESRILNREYVQLAHSHSHTAKALAVSQQLQTTNNHSNVMSLTELFN